mgnify:FL=1
MQEVEDAILQLRQEMEQADFVLVGAGAGLSAAAGISFADEQIFVQRYPYWAQRGLHSEYQMISFNQWTEAQQWAYMASHISRVRWEMPPLPLYRQLGALLEGKDYYILTSNVYRQFLRSGFAARRVFEYQGSYDLLCCSQGCTARVWPFYPVMKQMLAHIDVDNAAIPDKLLPRCPHCGAPLRLAFQDYPQYAQQKQQYQQWLQQTEQGMLCILELGVGFNSPGVIRVPFERITEEREQVRFFRVTADYPDSEEEIAYPEIPRPIADKSVSLNMDAAIVIERLLQQKNAAKKGRCSHER